MFLIIHLYMALRQITYQLADKNMQDFQLFWILERSFGVITQVKFCLIWNNSTPLLFQSINWSRKLQLSMTHSGQSRQDADSLLSGSVVYLQITLMSHSDEQKSLRCHLRKVFPAYTRLLRHFSRKVNQRKTQPTSAASCLLLGGGWWNPEELP